MELFRVCDRTKELKNLIRFQFKVSGKQTDSYLDTRSDSDCVDGDVHTACNLRKISLHVR